MLDLNTTYSAADAAKIAGIPATTLQNWLNRGVIVGHGDGDIEGGGTQGKHRRFSFYAVMQISIAAGLIRASGGMDLKEAFTAAMIFAHSGDGPTGWVDDQGAIADNGDPLRDPGFPFHFRHGRTLLACTQGDTTIVLLRPNHDVYTQIRMNLRRAEGFVVIDTSAVFERFCGANGLHPYHVLDAAYPKVQAA